MPGQRLQVSPMAHIWIFTFGMSFISILCGVSIYDGTYMYDARARRTKLLVQTTNVAATRATRTTGKWVRVVDPKEQNDKSIDGTWWVNSEYPMTGLNPSFCPTSLLSSGGDKNCPFGASGVALNDVLTSFVASVAIPLCIWACYSGARGPFKADNIRWLIVYIALIAWRAIVLYYALGEYVEGQLDVSKRPEWCWYDGMRRKGRCAKRFDFADHVVLFSVNYILVIAVEQARDARHDMMNAAAIRSAIWWRIPRYIVVTTFQVICLQSQLVTAAYFHTPLECFVGLAVATIAAIVPVTSVLAIEENGAFRFHLGKEKKKKPI